MEPTDYQTFECRHCGALFTHWRIKADHEKACDLCECGTPLAGQFSGGEEHFDRHGRGECAVCYESRLADEAADRQLEEELHG